MVSTSADSVWYIHNVNLTTENVLEVSKTEKLLPSKTHNFKY